LNTGDFPDDISQAYILATVRTNTQSLLGETAVPDGNRRLEKNLKGSSTNIGERGGHPPKGEKTGREQETNNR